MVQEGQVRRLTGGAPGKGGGVSEPGPSPLAKLLHTLVDMPQAASEIYKEAVDSGRLKGRNTWVRRWGSKKWWWSGAGSHVGMRGTWAVHEPMKKEKGWGVTAHVVLVKLGATRL